MAGKLWRVNRLICLACKIQFVIASWLILSFRMMSDADRTNVRMTCHVTCACGKFHSNTGFGLRESTRTSNSTHAFIVQCVFRSTWINLLTQSVANGNWKRFTQTFGTMFGMSSILFCCSLTTRTMPVDTGWNWKIASEPSTKWKHAMYSSLE